MQCSGSQPWQPMRLTWRAPNAGNAWAAAEAKELSISGVREGDSAEELDDSNLSLSRCMTLRGVKRFLT